MDTPGFKEDHISQIRAVQLLQKLGYKYLSPEEALQLRNNKTTNVILEDILRKQLKEINSEKRISSTKFLRSSSGASLSETLVRIRHPDSATRQH